MELSLLLLTLRKGLLLFLLNDLMLLVFCGFVRLLILSVEQTYLVSLLVGYDFALMSGAGFHILLVVFFPGGGGRILLDGD